MSDSLPPPSSPDLPPPTPPPVVPAAPLPPVIPAADAPPPPSSEPSDGSDIKASNSEEKTLGLVMYLLPLLGLSSFTHVGIGAVALMAVAPMVLWLIKKDSSRYLDTAGKEVINFNICAAACFIALWVLWEIGRLIWLGWLFALIMWIAKLVWVAMTILGAVGANSGTVYRFPFNYPVVK